MSSRKQAFSALVALLVPFGVSAETLPVQAGEHQYFTRFVVEWPNNRAWKAYREIGKVVLELQDHKDGFDTSRTFELVPKKRVLQLESTAKSLTLNFECDCDVAAFSNGKGFLVIDIAESGKSVVTPLSITETSAPSKSKVPQQSKLIAARLPWAAKYLEPQQSSIQQNIQPIRQLPTSRTDPIALPPQTAQRLSLLNQVQQQLAEEIGTATTFGLLDFALNARPTTPLVSQARKAQEKPTTGQNSNIPKKHNPAQNIRVTTSRDVPLGSPNSQELPNSTGALCPHDSAASVDLWGDDRDFSTQISAHRNALYVEFDRINPEAVNNLARTYAYFGFGAESLQVLRLIDENPTEKSFEASIAEILEHGFLPGFQSISRLHECDSDIALWSILSMQKIPDGTIINIEAVLRALSKLPLHLRQIVAPPLSNRLLVFGEETGAMAVMRTVERAPEKIAPTATLAIANIALKNGKIETGRKKLEEVIETNAAPSPEALLILLNQHLANREPISQETIVLVEAYSQELRGTELGRDFLRARTLALSLDGQFDAAFQTLEEFSHDGQISAAIDLRLKVVADLIANASDIVFLDHTFQQVPTVLSRLEPEVRLALIRRMLSLGFASSAQGLLTIIPEGTTDSDRQLLAAEIALSLGQPNQALAFIVGVETIEAEKLRAQATFLTGGASEAALLFEKADEPDAAAQSAWLSDNWAELTQDGTSVFAPIATLATTASEVSVQPEGMLARSTAAVEESTAARQAILDLLNAPEIQLIDSITDDGSSQ